MKATIEIPDELYRLVKAKSAIEGRAIREVTVELYERYVGGQEAPAEAETATERDPRQEGEIPTWFGALNRTARGVTRHDMNAIRESIARGIARDRER